MAYSRLRDALPFPRAPAAGPWLLPGTDYYIDLRQGGDAPPGGRGWTATVIWDSPVGRVHQGAAWGVSRAGALRALRAVMEGIGTEWWHGRALLWPEEALA